MPSFVATTHQARSALLCGTKHFGEPSVSPDSSLIHQLFSARPMLGFADYRMPVAGLYLCGSGAHPGGGVTGAPGHNAAQAVIADLL